VKRQVEVEILPLAAEENLGVMTYSPVGGGLLSGKYGPDKSPSQSRLISNKEYTERYSEDWVLETAGKFTELAVTKGLHPVSLAVAWAGAHQHVTCPIIGARNLEQLQPSLDCGGIEMTPDLWREIAGLGRTPPPPTDRLEEQR